ncbi:MAG: SCO family protein [Melioribacteraceae bacterium]|nr:SCO family protein [Melioribacteraceae bacterium]
MKKLILFVTLVFTMFYLSSCGDSLPIEEDLSNKNYELLNQDSVEVTFPDVVSGKIAIVGYVFTNCPDICPLTTNNMRIIQEKVKEEGIEDVEFVTVSFDPEYDTPSVLKEYAEIRKLDTSNWTFLTGEKSETDRLIRDVGVVAVPSDSTEMEDGEMMYFYIHTDRIAIVDQEGRVRKNYLGSTNHLNLKCENCGEWIDQNVMINQDFVNCPNCNHRNEFESQLAQIIADIKTLAN